ncbi:uncharacterized protein LOC131882681 isoform X2 [Tigriopus californicus]|nr:uncharacterized protein LOC131882681 isoform X2 [Tigriopus californicus]
MKDPSSQPSDKPDLLGSSAPLFMSLPVAGIAMETEVNTSVEVRNTQPATATTVSTTPSMTPPCSPSPSPPPPPPSSLPPPRKPSAIEVELELLRPLWHEEFLQRNPGASPDQIKILVDLKLEELSQLIPRRGVFEKKFRDNCQMMREIKEYLEHILAKLQGKAISDSSARIEDHHSQFLIKDWESVRLPALEHDFQQASQSWFKPTTDPLFKTFSSIKSNFTNLIAQFEYERSMRPVIRGVIPLKAVNKSVTLEESPQTYSSPTATNIPPFNGDMSDPNVLEKFAKWKKAWLKLVHELEKSSKSNSIVLFQELTNCLTGKALELISHYPRRDKISYVMALKDLTDQYQKHSPKKQSEPPNGVGAQVKPRCTRQELIKRALMALKNLRNFVRRNNVDMHNCAFIAAFVRAMPSELNHEWTNYKVEKQKEYEDLRHACHLSGEKLPPWESGMVENYASVKQWLLDARADKSKSTRSKLSV